MTSPDAAQIFHEAVLADGGRADLSKQGKVGEELLRTIRDGYVEALGLAAMPIGSPRHEFYVDYIDGAPDEVNAIAFVAEGIRFIGITTGLARKAMEHAHKVSGLPELRQVVGLPDTDHHRLTNALFHVILAFVVCHEYSHHHWGHVDASALKRLREFDEPNSSGMKRQADEVNADGFAAFLVLTHLIRGELRPQILSHLNHRDNEPFSSRLLLALFISAVASFFALHLTGPFDESRVRILDHPPTGIRMKYLMQHVRNWTDNSVNADLNQWLTPDVYRRVVRAAIGEIRHNIWTDEVRWAQSQDGIAYEDELSRVVNAAKKKIL